MSKIKMVKGGVTSAQGFLAGAVFAGIKASNKGREDMALVASEVPAAAAGVFTTNRVKAAPMKRASPGKPRPAPTSRPISSPSASRSRSTK